MICVSILEKKVEDLLVKLHGLELAEVRFEQLESLTNVEIEAIFQGDTRIVATMRPGNHSDARRRDVLCRAIDAGAAYVDLEYEADTDYLNPIIRVARERHCKVIISYHNHTLTPTTSELGNILEGCFQKGADVAKIACTVNELSDNARILSMLDDKRPVIAIGMGPLGKISRVASALMGAEFTFASLEKGLETADGQLDVATMSSLLSEFRK